MSTTKQMLDAYPRDFNVDADLLVRCIDACYECTQTCTACADDCLSEDSVADLIKCIRLDDDCADACYATARIVSRQTEYDANVTRSVLEACVTVCRACADECERHVHMEHCQICARVCRACEQACRDLLAAIA
jgi:hypothetical protein